MKRSVDFREAGCDARNEWPVVIAAPKRPTFVIFKPSRDWKGWGREMDQRHLARRIDLPRSTPVEFLLSFVRRNNTGKNRNCKFGRNRDSFSMIAADIKKSLLFRTIDRYFVNERKEIRIHRVLTLMH